MGDAVKRDIRVPATGEIDGASVTVRKPGRSQRVRIMTAARFERTEAGMARFQEYLCRASIVGAEGLKDLTTGEPVPFKKAPHDELGMIATREVYDAIPEAMLRPIGEALDVFEKPDEDPGKN